MTTNESNIKDISFARKVLNDTSGNSTSSDNSRELIAVSILIAARIIERSAMEIVKAINRKKIGF